ncbi:MAG: hypothetical protein WCY74_00385 [Sphaerochaetaceae bacterium]|jgi:hypothetical protein|nr:hypothetical protein [Sphaerochaetaceae bacterium]MDD3940892.1 hypothetical protein [Sphaerochaetaceae bacterium]MDX9939586.1 hypothetical protein [Sphaerochaetaceae bacterium]
MKPILLVMAAGMGSRYGGIKQIDGVGLHEEALLDFSTYDALQSGFGKIVFIIRKDIEKDFRQRIFDRVARNCDATYVFQELNTLLSDRQEAASKGRKKPWGTIHAVLSAKHVLDAPFCVINSDDYYGREAYRIMGAHLSSIGNDSAEHAMVGYVLKNTTSLSGSVSRAICSVKDGYLVSMRENKKIYHQGEQILSSIDGEERVLGGDEWVSMNYFGFAPSVLPFFQDYFDRFLAEHVSSEKEECYLPEGTSLMVRQGKGRMRFFTTTERWFGMTYQEDRQIVKDEIADRIARGIYPEKLWPN